ncbi:phenylacetaldehyde reductase-like [Rosa chinensis]|uniref:phenylacetaldehyde reductase-like n=1 Tax=Rosa chinensis TaxID=74649 RepID=UPI000D094562|nr:phenylacetaldehyde reductase-like [Rosa chinensis]
MKPFSTWSLCLVLAVVSEGTNEATRHICHSTLKILLLAEDDGEMKHLEALEGAQTRLRLFQIDLLDYNSISAAVHGCSGVFHLASPCIVDQVHDPQKELLDPAIKGTLNVLTAAKQAGVKRVVLTSSISAITLSPNWPADVVKSEDCWTDVEYCKQKGLWYPLSKTLAEKAAWEFAEEKGLDVVVVNPGKVMGDVISPRLNASKGQRKKRVASYKVYTLEGKLKGTLRKSFRWLKQTCDRVVYGR